ncbi:unnamed protein product [Protopolystoma xenopodis]|uniref:Uncharacterized protein n=1 Tax=Protopolystoma xenopodis TaxID=117903 RepID=A0A3S5FBP5_9PLAT|nr:unnamed protein product [Protopolystoma xenopodis]
MRPIGAFCHKSLGPSRLDWALLEGLYDQSPSASSWSSTMTGLVTPANRSGPQLYWHFDRTVKLSASFLGCTRPDPIQRGGH